MDAIFEEMPRARLAVLLKHFSQISDDRQPWRVVYPLAEVLVLLTCATIASCDDFEDIVAWGEQHLDFLRRSRSFISASPAHWLQTLVNRIDPVLFGRCFESWIKELWPDRHDLITIDGKTSTIDAMGCQVAIDADYLLALKGNQPTLEAEVADYFRSAPAEEVVSKTIVEKGHGRIETRTCAASSKVD